MNMNILNIILMAGPQATDGVAPKSGSSMSMMIMMILILAIFWIFMIRPQSKQQKELRKFRESLQKGDKVITTGGIYGKIVSTTETTVILQVDENTKLTVDKSSLIKDPSNLQQPQK